MSLRDPEAVAAIVSALQYAHGDDTARVLAEGVALAAVIQAVLAGPMSNRDAVQTVARSLADFAISPDLGPMWHVRYLYERPGSFKVVDMAVATPTGTIPNTEVTVRLAV